MARRTVRFGSTTEFDTTVTSESRAADKWVRGVLACRPQDRPLVIGVGCKWKPTSDPWPPISSAAVLQLCVGTSCLVHQLFNTRLPTPPSSIARLLDDPDVRLVGAGDDAAKLAHALGLACVDLRGVCHERFFPCGWFTRVGIEGFARQTLHLNLERPAAARVDWTKRDLDAEQVEYACVDAYVAYKLGVAVFGDRESAGICEMCLRAARPEGCFLHATQACGYMFHLQRQ